MRRFFVPVGYVLVLLLPGSLQAESSGERIFLSTGELFIPSCFELHSDAVDLVFHMHGSSRIAENCLVKTQKNAVMIAIHLGSFSSPYQNYFSNSSRFQSLVVEAMSVLKNRCPNRDPHVGYLCVTAFSGGYGGVRELLEVEEYYQRIGGLLLLDCPHTSYTDGRLVDPDQMRGFLRFAGDAAEKRKTFVLTHSEIVPGTYASTTECADYLIDRLGGQRQAVRVSHEFAMERSSQFESGWFRVYGFKGNTGDAHMKHFHNMDRFLSQFPFGAVGCVSED